MQNVFRNVAAGAGGGGSAVKVCQIVADRSEPWQVQLKVVVLVVFDQENVDVVAQALDQGNQLCNTSMTQLPKENEGVEYKFGRKIANLQLEVGDCIKATQIEVKRGELTCKAWRKPRIWSELWFGWL